MEGLYNKVIKGVYSSVPSVYSSDLTTMIRCLLTVDPNHRPTIEHVLQMSFVQDRIEKLFPEETLFTSSQTELKIPCQLISTIKDHKDLKAITN